MKTGDLVRFQPLPSMDGYWQLALLVKYEPWEKVGTILHEGKVLRIRASQIQKAGKKDFE